MDEPEDPGRQPVIPKGSGPLGNKEAIPKYNLFIL